MKFALPLSCLADTLGIVSRAVTVKGVRPILANLLIVARGDEIRVVGTDMEIMMISRLSGAVESEGHFTIPAKLLHEVVQSIAPASEQETIAFEVRPNEPMTPGLGQPYIEESVPPNLDQPYVEGAMPPGLVYLQCGRNQFNLQIQGIEDYPPIPALEGETFPRFDMESAALKKGLKEVAIAMATEEANPSQRSICMNFTANGEIVLVATDGKRLAVTGVPNLTYPPEFQASFLLPARAVPELIKLLDESVKVNVGLYLKQLVFTTPKLQLLSRLIDGKFPDYHRVMPKERSRRMTLCRKEFAQAIRTVVPIARHVSQMVRLDIKPTEMRVWAASREEGLSESFVPVRLEGNPIEIAFNGAYLNDFLSVLDDDETIMDMTTPGHPGVLRAGKSASSFVYVIMPMSS